MNFVAFGNDELSRLPAAKPGLAIVCPQCGKRHRLQAAKDTDGNPSSLTLFYNCGKKSYLGAVGGRVVVGTFKTGGKP